MKGKSVTNEAPDTAAIDEAITYLAQKLNPEVIEASSLYDLIDEDMNFPDWS